MIKGKNFRSSREIKGRYTFLIYSVFYLKRIRRTKVKEVEQPKKLAVKCVSFLLSSIPLTQLKYGS